MTRKELEAWQFRMAHIIERHVQMSYDMQGFTDIAPIDMKPVQDMLHDALSDACGKAWARLDPLTWMNEPNDGTRSDDLHDGRYGT